MSSTGHLHWNADQPRSYAPLCLPVPLHGLDRPCVTLQGLKAPQTTREMTLSYVFPLLGVHCVKTLMRVGAAQQYWHDTSRPHRFVTVEEFAAHFKAFSVGRQIQADLALPPPQTPLGSVKHGEPEVRSHSTSGCFYLCLHHVCNAVQDAVDREGMQPATSFFMAEHSAARGKETKICMPDCCMSLQGVLVRKKYGLSPLQVFQACWEVRNPPTCMQHLVRCVSFLLPPMAWVQLFPHTECWLTVLRSVSWCWCSATCSCTASGVALPWWVTCCSTRCCAVRSCLKAAM